MSKTLRITTLAALVLAAVWIVPPVVHRVERRCPLRPEPMGTAQALPSYSRKYGYACSQCHVAFPVLNDFGRRFKMNGFALEGEGVLESADKQLWTEKIFPWGVIVRSRLLNGKGTISHNPQWNGPATAGTMPNGSQFTPLNDVDMFVAGGDAAKHVSYEGEIDANAPGNFTPGLGDLQAGWHPSSYFNVILARKNFFVMEPYQTLSGMQSPTVAARATDGLMPDQNSLSGNTLTEQTATGAVFGHVESDKLGSLFYMAGVSGPNNDNQGREFRNANVRLAYEKGGVMIGSFGSFGQERPGAIPVNGGAANISQLNPSDPAMGPVHVRYLKTGVDAMVEYKDLIGRGAFLYQYDAVNDYDGRFNDPLGINGWAINNVANGTASYYNMRRMRDRSAYVELMYSYKRDGHDYPFLLPLIRENWYTTYNGTRQFNYLTFHLSHYFKSNVRVFGEYSVDTKSDRQGVPNAATLAGNGAPRPYNDNGHNRVGRGGCGTLQFEVGF